MPKFAIPAFRVLPLAALVCLLTLFSCGRKAEAPSGVVVQPQELLSAFPQADVSRKEPLRFVFKERVVAAASVGEAVPEGMLTFTPAVAGTARWRDGQTLAFEPEEFFESGSQYIATIDLGKIGGQGGSTSLEFKTRVRGLDVELGALRTAGDGGGRWLSLEGTLHAADYEPGEALEKTITATQDQSNLPVKWSHSPDGRLHRFTIDNIERKNYAGKLLVRWDAAGLGLPARGEKSYDIPGIDVFSLLTIATAGDPVPHVLLTFSDPLDPDQDLTGLIHAEGVSFDLEINGNQVRAVPRGGWTGAMTVQVATGIRNRAGGALRRGGQQRLVFEEPQPAVRFADAGVIVPNQEAAVFPFEAVNVKAVDVRVVRISEKNVPQFLQVNQLNQQRELYRVGKEVLHKKVALDGDPSLNLKAWNRHGLDLSELVKLEPGALYQVTLGFRKSYSLYSCNEGDGGDSASEESVIGALAPEQDASYWNYYQDYSNYNYRHRNNPCHRSYYTGSRLQRRNFLASNLGLTVKRQPNDDLHVFVTDLNTAKPLSNVGLSVYDFQQTELAIAKTDSRGHAVIKDLDQPFLVIAKYGVQRGYLNLNDGYALSMSRFEVGGARAQKGLRGYIYGERGVWRPGDPIHLTFVLQDAAASLPKDHPVVLKFTDPRGRLVEQRVSREGVDGFYAFTLETEEEAPTGMWSAVIDVGGVQFRKPIRVETIMPNRLKIGFALDREQLVVGEEAWADMSANWLHGAVAKELKADVRVNYVRVKTRFKTFEDFSFDDPTRFFRGQERLLKETVLDQDGKARFTIEINEQFRPPGVLRADFTTRVFEPSGAFSIDAFSVPVHPYRSYVGVKPPRGDAARNMLLTDRDHEVQIVTLDPAGKPVSRQGVKVEVFKLSWEWWWDQESNSLTSRQAGQLVTPLSQGLVNTVNGQGRYTLNVKYPEWGRYLIRVTDPDGHRAGRIVYIDWPGWAGRRQQEGGGDAARLSFEADKSAYRVGDEVLLSLPSAQNSRILVSLERGETVLETHWLEGRAGTVPFRFKTTAAMAPNVYAHVTLIQPQARHKNDRPMRLYGVIPIPVEDPGTRLQPQITMADVLQPEQEVTIEVAEKTGRAMTYTLAMVDDGLLDLTRFKTPDPWGAFYAKQALLVKTYDQFRSVLGASGMPLTQILAVGGGEDGGGDKPPKMNRFKPVVFALGPFRLEPGQRKTHKLTLPNYVGSVRTMVVAGRGTAYGSAEKTTPVRKPLMLLASAPRVLGPGERFALPVTLFAMEEDVREVQVTLNLEGDATLRGDAQQTVTFTQTGDQTLPLFAEVGQATGTLTFKAEAVAGKHRASTEVSVDVRNPNPEMVKTHDAVVAPGSSFEYAYQAVGMKGSNQGVVEVSSVPALNLGRRLDYLVRYPHGCVEQTTSAAFPQLYLSKLMKLAPDRLKEVEENIHEAMGRLARFQQSSGGLSYWPGQMSYHFWSTSYAGHFMLEAKRLGYALPAGFLGPWKQFQTHTANNWQTNEHATELDQAYRLFTLALADAPALGAMNRFRETRPTNDVARYLLAAAYHLAGRPEGGDQLVAVQHVAYREYRDTDITLGSLTRDQALVIEARLHMGQRGALVEDIKKLSATLNGPQWLSTHSTAFALMAMARFADAGMGLRFELALGGSAAQNLTQDKPIYQHLFDPDRVGNGSLTLNNPMETPLFVTTILRGRPAAGQEIDTASQLSMMVNYQDYDGKPVDVRRLQQGQTFFAKVKVTHPNKQGRTYRHLALSSVFPSGWEINQNPPAAGNRSREAGYTYRDVRDDRVHTYFHLKPGETKEFSVLLTAAYLGRYYLPATSAEAMYDATINASVHGYWVEVVP
ncbi:alpha-2-macroglobulin family protein [Acanthopleuribacter pedis]|uniref:Alpha-2-macroglobulin n=1 Tax=Acanthopleuribacter pedis TaxID=442870 RepID=A0A8J7QGD7_9BACT|nr:MG2 domain-containing protein [Acanthopleuribacter pedis]MBO1319871.1 hypothetical protein [Acanthopleuribacter pedis]